MEFEESEIYDLLILLTKNNHDESLKLVEKAFRRWYLDLKDDRMIGPLINSLKNINGRLNILDKGDISEEDLKDLVKSFCPNIFTAILFTQNETLRLSLKEIESLMETTLFKKFTATTVQNWIQKELKEVIGPPELGKKYSVRQISYLLLVDDLKTSIGSYEIKKILNLLDKYSDNQELLVLKLIKIYTNIVELSTHIQKKLLKNKTISKAEMEELSLIQNNPLQVINKKIKGNFDHLNEEMVENLAHITLVSYLSKNASILKFMANGMLEDIDFD